MEAGSPAQCDDDGVTSDEEFDSLGGGGQVALRTQQFDDLFTLGMQLLDRESYPNAVRVFQFLVQMSPQNVTVRCLLGQAYVGCDNHERARDTYLQATRLKGADMAVWFRLATLYEFEDNQRYAVASYLRALDLCCYALRSKEYEGQSADDRSDEAQTFVTVLRSLAELYARQGQVGTALALYRRALQAAPYDSDLRRTLVALYVAIAAQAADHKDPDAMAHVNDEDLAVCAHCMHCMEDVATVRSVQVPRGERCTGRFE